MRVMVLIKANTDSEAGKVPSERRLTDMLKFNEELVRAGILLAGEGLHPSRRAKRIRFSGARRTVIEGPFPDTQHLVAGFWLWQVRSMDEATEWVKRIPQNDGEEAEVEIRPVFEADDFGSELSPELRAQEQRLRAKAARSF